jgi:hypothetical protein
MLGEAGIGLFLLGLRHDVASGSYPVARPLRRRLPVDDAEPLRQRIARTCFPYTTSSLDRACLSAALPSSRSPLCTAEHVNGAFAALVANRPDLESAFALDSLLLDRARDTPFDCSLHFLCRAFPIGGGLSERVVLAPWVELVESGEGHGLVFASPQGRWVFRQLPTTLAALIHFIRIPRTLGAVARELQRGIVVDPGPSASWVRGEILNLHGMGIVISNELADGLRPLGRPAPDKPGRASERYDVRSDRSPTAAAP